MFRASPRQSDVMIVAGTLCNKMAPALRKVRSVPCPLCRSALAVCLSAVCLSVCPSVCLHLSVYASLCLSLFLLSMSIVCSCAVPLAAAFTMLLRFPKAVSSPGARRRNLVESALNIPGFRFFFFNFSRSTVTRTLGLNKRRARCDSVLFA